jgi:hypothetical protein
MLKPPPNVPLAGMLASIRMLTHGGSVAALSKHTGRPKRYIEMTWIA